MGVSERNAKYVHNKYVFGRMEFTDRWWESRFGDERVLFEIGDLDDAISLSLHDQEQPFAKSQGSDVGHTQLIEHGKLKLREIKGDRRQQQWTQYYNVGEAPSIKHTSSFVQEVFVGQDACRLGLALSLIRELRRMGSPETSSAHQKAVTELKATLFDAITSGQDQVLQNIFKDFFRVEIRVPAYINLRTMKTLHHMGSNKRDEAVVLQEYAQGLALGLERSTIHRALVQASLCLQLARLLNVETFNRLVATCIAPLCTHVLSGRLLAPGPRPSLKELKQAVGKVKKDQTFVAEKLAAALNALHQMLEHLPHTAAFIDCRACGAMGPGDGHVTAGHIESCPTCHVLVAINYTGSWNDARFACGKFARWIERLLM